MIPSIKPHDWRETGMCGRQEALQTQKYPFCTQTWSSTDPQGRSNKEITVGGSNPTQSLGQDIYPWLSQILILILIQTMDFEPFPKGKPTGIPACHVFVLVLETDLTRNNRGKKQPSTKIFLLPESPFTALIATHFAFFSPHHYKVTLDTQIQTNLCSFQPGGFLQLSTSWCQLLSVVLNNKYQQQHMKGSWAGAHWRKITWEGVILPSTVW